jgi:LysR family transcriptional regulator, nitrogen assimilation regulatory protein
VSLNTLGLYLIPSVISQLANSHSGLQVAYMAASAPEVVEKVGRGHADLGLVYDQAVNTDEFVLHRLHQEVLSGYVARNAQTPLDCSVAQLQQHRLILPPRPYTLRRVMERELSGQLLIGAESNDISVSLELAGRGIGLAVLPQLVPANLLTAHRVRRVRLLSDQIKRPVVAITRKTEQLGDAVALTLAAVKSRAWELVRPS